MGNNGDAKHLLSVSIPLGDSEGKIEKLFFPKSGLVKIRISCGTQDRPLDLTEKELAVLLQKAIRAGVLSSDFLRSLQDEFEI